ncbi:MAG: hypothetical protein JST48_02265 [Bacteroidetes bacterium]|nr:hypothetical protein [Bacteroidota bacterium]
MKHILIGMLLLSRVALAQTFTDKITRELKFEKPGINNTLVLANLNGSMNVRGYEGDKIIIEAERIIKAKSEARLEQGKKEIQLKQIDRLDTLIIYVGGGCNHFTYRKNSKHGAGWGYHWNCNDEECNPPYDYTFNFSVKVPVGLNIEVSTVNDGNVFIENIKGAVSANNVNGSIKLTSIQSTTYASTINGNVDVDYSRNPSQDCKYYSLNGDINALFEKGLAADVSFKSFNGDLYTNVQRLESLSALVEKKQSEEGYSIKIGRNRFKVGQGGANLDFETFNGDVIVKEK